MGFADVYENILSFLLELPGNADGSDYTHLVQRNREAFNGLYNDILGKVNTFNGGGRGVTKKDDRCIRLVEPRGLHHLLNYIETYSTRLLFTPRPFYRSNLFSMTSLVQTGEQSHLACLFCGKASYFDRINDLAVFTPLPSSAVDKVKRIVYTFPATYIGGDLFANDLDHESQPNCTTEQTMCVEDLHHTYCPVLWLQRNENAKWRYKDAPFIVRGVSRFNHLMQFLSIYPRPRDHASWLCLISRMTKCTSAGATECTLESLFYIVCHERLVQITEGFEATLAVAGTVDRTKYLYADDEEKRVNYDPESPVARTSGPLLRFYSNPMHVNQYAYEVENLSDVVTGPVFNERTTQLGDVLPNHPLPFGGSYAVLSSIQQNVVTERANSKQPYRTTHRGGDPRPERSLQFSAVDLSSAFVDGTVTNLQYYRLLFLQGFLVNALRSSDHTVFYDASNQRYGIYGRLTGHVCLGCGVLFDNQLTNYENTRVYYPAYQEDRLVKYAIHGSRNNLHRHVYGRQLPPVPNFPAVFPKDLVWNIFPKCGRIDERLRQALVWFSSSLDVLHANHCVFRISRHSYSNDKCHICLDDKPSNGLVSMTCGHMICTSCYNEVFITDCCFCRTGHRTKYLTVSDRVVEGYSKHMSIEE